MLLLITVTDLSTRQDWGYLIYDWEATEFIKDGIPLRGFTLKRIEGLESSQAKPMLDMFKDLEEELGEEEFASKYMDGKHIRTIYSSSAPKESDTVVS